AACALHPMVRSVPQTEGGAAWKGSSSTSRRLLFHLLHWECRGNAGSPRGAPLDQCSLSRGKVECPSSAPGFLTRQRDGSDPCPSARSRGELAGSPPDS